MDLDGEFEIVTFKIGEHKSDPSYVRLAVTGRDEAHLDAIMSDLHRLGAQVPEIEDVRLGAADKDRAVPKGFYSTTNHPTFIHHRGAWIPVEDIEMDCTIVVRDDGRGARRSTRWCKGTRSCSPARRPCRSP